MFAGGIRGMVSDLLDRKDTRAFFPYIASLFLYIFLCNIQGRSKEIVRGGLNLFSF